MHTSDDIAEENQRLRRTMRDLVALSTLPAVWTTLAADGIARSLADVLLNTLSLDFVYVRLTGPSQVIEVVRAPGHEDAAARLTAALASLLTDERIEPTRTIPDPFGAGTLHAAVTRFGISDAAGVMVAASRRANFPTEQERLLLGVGTNQMATVVERRRTETALRESEERFRTLFQSMDEGYCVIEFFDGPHGPLSDYVHVLANPAYAANAGIPNIVGQKVREMVPDEAEAWIEIYRNVLVTGEPVRFERELVATGRHLDLAAFRIEPPERRQVAVLFKDITARKRAQIRLQEAEARFRTMADNSPVLIWQTNESGAAFVNRHYLDFFGVPFDAVAGMGWAKFLHPEDGGYLTDYQSAFARHEGYESDARLRRHDGEYRWLHTVATPHHGPDGMFIGFIGCSFDVTEIRRAAEELRDADRRKDEFLATLAHELRNPLAPIHNAVQIMKMSDQPQVREEARTLIERQLGQMVRLVDDLMDVSRITRNKLELKREKVDLAKVIENAVETSRPLIDQMGHHLTVELPPQPVYVDADTTRLAQVFLNLLNNSAKYTEPGGCIWLTAELQGSNVVVSVRDNGIGIPAVNLPSVFDLFSQVQSGISRSQGGLGIGLSLVKRLVELHGGNITASSEGRGRGSTFAVHLPAVISTVQESPPTRDPIGSSTRHRILLVDDNADAANSLAMLLTILGNEVRTAHDGLEGVEVAAAFRPDLIFLDIGMPKLNGYDAATRIREQPWGKAAVLVALTGWGQDEDRQKSEAAGFDRHMVKPVDPAALHELLNRSNGIAPDIIEDR